MDIVIAFFLLGVVARLIKSDIKFPTALYESLVLFLMIAIGLKGGMALAEHSDWQILQQSLVVIALGFVLPLLAFPVLFYIGQLRRIDAASIAAHYGSVSVGTYAVAVSVLEAKNIDYEPYFPLFVVLLEMPAIVVGLALANTRGKKLNKPQLFHEVFCNQGVVVMVGALAIGFWANEGAASITPLFVNLFHGALALFLLEMGLVAAGRLAELRKLSVFLLAFGVGIPLLFAALGCGLGVLMGLSTGGVILLAVLAGSASYIAVPAAMRVALPEANHSLSIAASLGVTFPFNVIIGIPCYVLMGQWVTA